MSVITLFNALHCNEELIVPQLVEKTGYRLIKDAEVVAQASRLSGLAPDRVNRAFVAKASLFNPFTHEKERSIAYLRLAVAEILAQGNLVVTGFCSHFIPASITHALRICLVAEMNYRLQVAQSQPTPDKDALKTMHKSQEDNSAWTMQLLGKAAPWDPAL